MKSWMRPVAYMGIMLCLINGAKSDDSKNQEYRNSRRKYKESVKILWDADTLIKDSNKDTHKSLYELMLPDSVLHNTDDMDSTGRIKLRNHLEIENEILDLRVAAAQEYDKFFETKNREYALKAIAYLQYTATRYPGTYGSELQRSARLIDGISKELRKNNKNY